MKPKILKSALVSFGGVDAFNEAVRAHAREMDAWQKRDVIVKSQVDMVRPVRPEWSDFEGDGDAFSKAVADYETAISNWFDPVKKPTAPTLVASAVRSFIQADGDVQYVPNYEIVNDDPSNAEVLRSRKNELLRAVSVAEVTAKEAADIPLGKRPLAAIRERDIMVAESARAQEFLKKQGNEFLDASGLESYLSSTRSPDDAKHLEDQAARRSKIENISRMAAQVMNDIEDLELDNIDSFQIPLFN